MIGFSVLREALKKLNWKDANVNANVRKLLMSYESDEMEWKDFYFLADIESYSEHEVCTVPDKFMMVIIIWKPATCGPLQDFGDSLCHTKILKGSLLEEHYTYDESKPQGKRLKLKNNLRLELNKVSNPNESKDLHRFVNHSDEDDAVSLHIYKLPVEKIQYVDMLTEEKTIPFANKVDCSMDLQVTRL